MSSQVTLAYIRCTFVLSSGFSRIALATWKKTTKYLPTSNPKTSVNKCKVTIYCGKPIKLTISNQKERWAGITHQTKGTDLKHWGNARASSKHSKCSHLTRLVLKAALLTRDVNCMSPLPMNLFNKIIRLQFK